MSSKSKEWPGGPYGPNTVVVRRFMLECLNLNRETLDMAPIAIEWKDFRMKMEKRCEQLAFDLLRSTQWRSARDCAYEVTERECGRPVAVLAGEMAGVLSVLDQVEVAEAEGMMRLWSESTDPGRVGERQREILRLRLKARGELSSGSDTGEGLSDRLMQSLREFGYSLRQGEKLMVPEFLFSVQTLTPMQLQALSVLKDTREAEQLYREVLSRANKMLIEAVLGEAWAVFWAAARGASLSNSQLRQAWAYVDRASLGVALQGHDSRTRLGKLILPLQTVVNNPHLITASDSNLPAV